MWKLWRIKEMLFDGIWAVMLNNRAKKNSPKVLDNLDIQAGDMISKCMAYHVYSLIYIPRKWDNAVKKHIRMRDDENLEFQKMKWQINAFYMRHGFHFSSGLSQYSAL